MVGSSTRRLDLSQSTWAAKGLNHAESGATKPAKPSIAKFASFFHPEFESVGWPTGLQNVLAVLAGCLWKNTTYFFMFLLRLWTSQGPKLAAAKTRKPLSLLTTLPTTEVRPHRPQQRCRRLLLQVP